MGSAAITTNVDVAQLVLYAFWIFFAGLIYYLVRENHREGYPMDTDGGLTTGWPVPSPKTFKLANGGEVSFPNDKVSPQTLNGVASNGLSGAPIDPVGNPLTAGVGPGAWADRADVPDLDYQGQPKILPLRSLPDFGVSGKDPDPRGTEVVGADGEVAGTVSDLWVDTSETLFRYLEVSLVGDGRKVLLPINFARITKRDPVKVHALYAAQFAGVPGTKNPDTVTILEEEKIQAYYGAGTLYADEQRAEPMF
jgi:photosynthetic reaction center H subunit